MTGPIVPAQIDFDDDGPQAPAFGDRYSSRSGADAQARHVFLAGNGLPGRWQGRDRFVIAETGFGLGQNFLATWAAWQADDGRCRRLWFVSVEAHPPTAADLQRALVDSPHPALAAQLLQAWPPLTEDLHTLAFDDGRVMLLLAFGDAGDWVPQWRLQADAFLLDGFAPGLNPAMWDLRLLKALASRAAPGATAATWCVARAVRDALVTAGFDVATAPGLPPKREMTVARHAPRGTMRPPRDTRRGDGEALVVGAGLAGAAAAWALAAEGWQVTVLDSEPAPAGRSSGNPAGLYHAIVTGEDGVHARCYRAAALRADAVIGGWIRAGEIPGRADGLLRLETRLPDVAAMQALLDRLGLPPCHVQALPAAEAAERSGCVVTHPAWWFPGGGWVSPAALVQRLLAGGSIRFEGGRDVSGFSWRNGRWQVLGVDGEPLGSTTTLVLAGGTALPRLAAQAAQAAGSGADDLPLTVRRGQVTRLAPAQVPRRPVVPVAGHGYAIPLPDGGLLCGATSHPVDAGMPGSVPRPGAADHAFNLARLAPWLGLHASALQAVADEADLDGRVGDRLAVADKLPLVGAWPQAGSTATRLADVPRVDGLYVCGAFGSRGITWAVLAGHLLAHAATGAPAPLAGRLVDAFDPARHAVRGARRRGPA